MVSVLEAVELICLLIPEKLILHSSTLVPENLALDGAFQVDDVQVFGD
jgi:hypothetical protein